VDAKPACVFICLFQLGSSGNQREREREIEREREREGEREREREREREISLPSGFSHFFKLTSNKVPYLCVAFRVRHSALTDDSSSFLLE